MASLNVGDTITIKVRNPLWRFRHVYASYVQVPEFYTYTGRLVAPVRGDPAGTVRITSGDPKYPVRLIDVDRIEDCDLSEQAPRVEQESWVVVGSRGSKYNVTRDGSHFSCTCAGFDFRKRCRHVDELRDKLAKEAA